MSNHEWTRAQVYSSPTMRSRYQGRLKQAAAAWDAAERYSAGTVRPSCLLALDGSQLLAAQAWAMTRGLEMTLVQTTMLSATGYTSRVPSEGIRGYRVALHEPGLRREWHDAWDEKDQGAVGRLLGFPPCCAAFFAEHWHRQGKVDLTPLMTGGPDGPWQANPLLRAIGVRAVPHLPCSWACQGTVELADKIEQQVMLDGTAEEREGWGYLREFLGWPMEWSAAHGAAELRTPAFKFMSFTDYTADELVLQRKGPAVPDAPTGLRYPMARPAQPQPVDIEDEMDQAYLAPSWPDNGFTTKEAQDAAHDLLALAYREGQCTGPTLDLGCGDGTLLARLGGGSGVDLDASRVLRGRGRNPGNELLWGDVAIPSTWPWPKEGRWGTILVSVQRFLEMPDCNAKLALEAIRDHADRVVLYDYHPGGPAFLKLCMNAGLVLPDPPARQMFRSDSAVAAVVAGKDLERLP